MIYFLRRLLFDHKTKQHLGWFDPRASYKKEATFGGGSNKLVDNGFGKKHEIFFQRGKKVLRENRFLEAKTLFLIDGTRGAN